MKAVTRKRPVKDTACVASVGAPTSSSMYLSGSTNPSSFIAQVGLKMKHVHLRVKRLAMAALTKGMEAKLASHMGME